ncbi:MAG: hypothetical protein P4K93_11795, partial [Terracidiphilus sp.]|nr:hypothetical protein [Terracidiphilus sp.]
MSEHEEKPIASEEPTPPPKRSRLRRFFLRHLPLSVASIAALLVVLAVGLYFVASSSTFENAVRKRLITSLEEITGGRAEIASFHWRLLHFEAEADGVVIHGLEDPGEAPYAKIDRLRVVFSLRNLFSPTVRLRSLEIVRPSLHFIVYPDGSTNQPQPRQRSSSSNSAIDTLFAMHASRISVEQGSLDYDCRNASFDYQNRNAPLDFSANDASLVMRYVRATFRTPASYRIEVGVTDLNLARTVPRNPLPVHGALQATLDLEHAQVFLRSLRITAERRGGPSHSLEVTGDLEDFTHPRWHAHVQGDLDMRLLDPITGYGDAPEGLARLNLSAAGQENALQIDGGVHIDGGSYIGAGVTASGITLDTRVHADGKQLLVTGIVARLRQGGQIEGTVALEPWLPTDASAQPQQAPRGTEESRANRNSLVRTPPSIIPVNGKVTANFKDVALDTVLDMVSPAPYRRLGLDARVNGPAVAVWTHGDGNTVSVNAQFGLRPSRQTPPGEVPTTGAIDATYAQHNGSVAVRKLEIHLPQSDLEAHGVLGAYPTASPSALTIDFHSHNLAEFDTGLRSLGYKRNGKTGAAALPVSLGGQADFHGTWTGSLTRPHIAGTVQATQLAVELPAGSSSAPQIVRFDSVSASGLLYSPSQIAIQHAQLERGTTRISLNGTIDASPGASPGREPVFDANAVLHAHFDAANLEVADVQPFVTAGGGPNLPLTGAFNARIAADGPLHALSASGSVQMERGSLYGDPISGLRVQAALAGQVLKLTSASFNDAGGNVSGSGTFDFKADRFQVDARAQNVDIARLNFVRSRNFDATAKLSFAISGFGSLDDPRLEGHATLTALTYGGQQFGTLQVAAHSTGPTIEYNATTQLEQAGLTLHGQTTLHGDYPTHAQLEFSRFNLGTLLRMAHMAEFNGESALAGTVSIDGPLAHPEQLHGEAKLRELAFTISGVQLQGDGGLHATLAGGRIHLDPLHVTGDNTDLHMQGDVSLQGSQQLDVAASGSINLKLAETLDPDLTASGLSTFKVEAHGPLQHPNLQGSIDFQDGALSLEDLPNGLSQLHGTLEFNQNRLEVRNLTAMSG